MINFIFILLSYGGFTVAGLYTHPELSYNGECRTHPSLGFLSYLNHPGLCIDESVTASQVFYGKAFFLRGKSL